MTNDMPGGKAARLGVAGWIFLAVSAAATGIHAETSDAAMGEPFTITHARGATLRTPKGDLLTIALLAVLSDERCPAETMCAWARPPLVSLRVSSGTHVEVVRLEIGAASRGASIDGWTLRGIDLSPSPQKVAEFARLLPIASYILGLTVVR